MIDNSLFSKICLFIICLCFPLFCICLVLDMYSNYKVHEFYKYHSEEFVMHNFCSNIYNSWYCSDDYFVSEL